MGTYTMIELYIGLFISLLIAMIIVIVFGILVLVYIDKKHRSEEKFADAELSSKNTSSTPVYRQHRGSSLSGFEITFGDINRKNYKFMQIPLNEVLPDIEVP